MADCPFCGGEISEAMALDGGTCPHCFGEIPGEDAPTNPGDDVLQAIAAKDESERKRKQNAPVMLLLPVVAAALAAVAYLGLNPAPVVEDMGEIIVPMEQDFLGVEDVAAEEPAGAEAQPTTRPTPRPSKPTPRGSSIDVSGPSARAVTSGGDATTTRGTRGSSMGTAGTDRSIGGLTTSAASGGLADGTDLSAIGPSRRKAKLTDADEIGQAVRDMLNAKVRTTRRCYERALNTNESYSGKWRIGATVGTDGKLKDISAEIEGGQFDGELQTCLINQMERWQLAFEIATEKPFSTVLSF